MVSPTPKPPLKPRLARCGRTSSASVPLILLDNLPFSWHRLRLYLRTGVWSARIWADGWKAAGLAVLRDGLGLGLPWPRSSDRPGRVSTRATPRPAAAPGRAPRPAAGLAPATMVLEAAPPRRPPAPPFFDRGSYRGVLPPKNNFRLTTAVEPRRITTNAGALYCISGYRYL